MDLMIARSRLITATCLVVASTTLRAEQPATPVSPGDWQASALVGQTCPNFSWGAVAGAERYELAIFDAQWNDSPLYAEQRALGTPLREVDIPAPALSWTPAGADCLEEGGSYLWFVRALTATEEGTWSPARYFEVDNLTEGLIQSVRRELAAQLRQPQVWRDVLQEVLATNTRLGVQALNQAAFSPATSGTGTAPAGRIGRLSSSRLPGVPSPAADFAINASAMRVSSSKGVLFDDPVGDGPIPAIGGGARFMWYPGKRALRVGYALGEEWNDASIGYNSVAMGFNTLGKGLSSTAMGESAFAEGDYSMAMNFLTSALGVSSTAMGSGTYAIGVASTAMGVATDATGDFATAMGDTTSAPAYASLVLGQYNATSGTETSGSWVDTDPVLVVGNGTFEVPANALTLLKNGDMELAGNLTALNVTNTSDRNAKENFAGIDPQAVLAKLAALPIETWNYQQQDPAIRHMGPMAQDFRTAFGLGEDDKTIATVDSDGVTMAAVQGLYQLVQAQQVRIERLEGGMRLLTEQNVVQQGLIVELLREHADLAKRLAGLEVGERLAHPYAQP